MSAEEIPLIRAEDSNRPGAFRRRSLRLKAVSPSENSFRIFHVILGLCMVLLTIGFALHAIDLLYDGRFSVTRQDYWRIYKLDLSLPFPLNALYRHNDHPLFFPSLIWLPILYFFHNDQTLLFFCGLAIYLDHVDSNVSQRLAFSKSWAPAAVGNRTNLHGRLSLARESEYHYFGRLQLHMFHDNERCSGRAARVESFTGRAIRCRALAALCLAAGGRDRRHLQLRDGSGRLADVYRARVALSTGLENGERSWRGRPTECRYLRLPA